MALDVGQWLQGLGLGQHAEAFLAARIDADVLTELTNADLTELGLPLGDRKRLLKAIAALGAAPVLAEAPSLPFVPARSREAERRQLTVMFVDLVGSTALSQRLDPEDMGQILKAYQNAVVGEISRLDGFTAKLMGDGVLAYFGWPKAHEDEAERAVRAGLAIVAAVAELAAPEPLACRVGIATGLVVVGDLIGEGASQEEAVVGDTPNLAARLQQMAAPGEVVVAEATRRLLGSGLAVESLGPSALKGIEPTTETFRVLGERAVESRFASRAGETVSPMIGRDEELALLLRQWREAAAGEGRAVLVVGEAGIGKSRLIRALREAVLADRPTVLFYQCSPSHADSPLWPVTQQLAFAARFEAADDAASRRAKLAQLVTPGDRLDLLASLLGIAGEPDPLANLDPRDRRRRTLGALVDQLLELSQRAPVLVLMEDVHWVDPSTIELLQRTLEAIASCPVLVVLTSRPEAEPGLGTFPHLSRLVLSRLGRAAVEAIVGRLLEARAMDATVRAQILARTDGVPLFVEELTKAVLEQAPAGLGVTVPSTLQDSLLARLDRDPLMKSVAQIAACIGREFDHALLAAVADLPPAELARGLDTLVAAELIYRRGTPPEASYSFKHALVRDAAYESLLRSRRREVHAKILEILEAAPGNPSELLAHHAAEAAQTAKAVRLLLLAGQSAADRSANIEATKHLQQGLLLLEALPPTSGRDRLELDYRLALGNSLILVRGWAAPETASAFERADELSRQVGGDGERISTLFGQFIVHLLTPDLASARTDGAELIEIGRRTGNAAPELIGHRVMASALMFGGDLTTSIHHWDRVVALYDSEQHAMLARKFVYDPMVHCDTQMARVLLFMGCYTQAQKRLDKGLASATAMRHAGTLGIAFYQALLFAAEARDQPFACQLATRFLPFALEQGFVAWHGAGELVSIWAARHADPEGIVSFEQALAVADRGGRLAKPLFLGLLTELHLCRDNAEGSLSAVQTGLETIGKTGEQRWLPELHRLRGVVSLRGAGNRTDAEHYLNAAIDLARLQSARLIELRASTSLARLWAEQGERQKAHDLLAPIYGWFTEGFDAPDLVEAKALLGQLA